MTVDEKKKFPLTNFTRIKGKTIAKDSDHNPLFVELDICFDKKRPARREYIPMTYNNVLKMKCLLKNKHQNGSRR